MPSISRLCVLLSALGFAAIGCEQFDPVHTENLCDGPAPISMRCPQCQTPKYSAKCAECTVDNPDPELCEAKAGTGEGPTKAAGRGGSGGAGGSTQRPRGGSGTPGTGEGGAGSGGAGTDGNEGEGGEGGESGESGSGGMSMSGEGGEGGASIDPGYCTSTDDIWCHLNQPSQPHCDVANRRCVECVRPEHCARGVCDSMIGRCRDCMVDSDCPGPSKACRDNLCVQCKRDEDCAALDPNSELGSCDTNSNSCVDCFKDNKGCTDSVRNSCDTTAERCVDCMDDGDCNTDKTKRACDPALRMCVPCLGNQHCTDRVLNTCDVDNRKCVDCLNDSGCDSGMHCDTKAQKCVECTADPQCPSGHCLNQKCVECKGDNDCESSDKAHCDPGTHRCGGCDDDDQCRRFSDTSICDTGSSKCAQCRDDSTCGGTACVRGQHACSNVPVHSIDVCRKCEADSMCRDGMRCVPLSFHGNDTDSYCVFLRSGSCGTTRGYTQSITHASIDNSSASFCIPPATTSCPGSVAAQPGVTGSLCENPSECGLGIDDAICNARRCTYVCDVDTDCPAGLSCLASRVCG